MPGQTPTPPLDPPPCPWRGSATDLNSPPSSRDALEGKGPQRGPQRRLGRRLEGLLSVTNAMEAGRPAHAAGVGARNSPLPPCVRLVLGRLPATGLPCCPYGVPSPLFAYPSAHPLTPGPPQCSLTIPKGPSHRRLAV